MTRPNIARPRKHVDNAAKQRAYRERNAHKKPITQQTATRLAMELGDMIRLAAMAGSPAALAITNEQDEKILRNLIEVFRREVEKVAPLT